MRRHTITLASFLPVKGISAVPWKAFRQALRYSRTPPSEQLARALLQQGKKEEAVEHYQEALRLVKAGRKG